MPSDPQTTEDFLALINQPLPQAEEAEAGILSCLLQDTEGKRLGECLTGVRAAAFYSEPNRIIYGALLEFYVDQKPIDIVTLSQWLREHGQLDKAGGPGRLSELFTFIPTTAHWDHYLGNLKEAFAKRQLIHTLAERIVAVHQDSREAQPVGSQRLLVDTEGALVDLHPTTSHHGLRHVRHYLPGAAGEIQAAYANRGHVTRGIATGFTDLDRATMGIETGLFVIAARPSKGKTVLMCQLALNMALGCGDYPQFNQPGMAVGVWSLETEGQRLVRRMLCNLAEINLGRARDGLLNRKKMDDLTTATQRLLDSQLYVEACFGLSIQEFRVKVRQAVKRYNLRAVFVDYLQLLTSASRAAQMSRTTMMVEVSTGLKALAHECGVPVFALAQINREGDKPRPSMGDIKDSGQIEQDADYIAILCDAEVEHADEDGEDDGMIVDLTGDAYIGLDLVKLKEGKTTTDGPPMKLKFQKEYFKLISTTFDFLSNNEDKRQH